MAPRPTATPSSGLSPSVFPLLNNYNATPLPPLHHEGEGQVSSQAPLSPQGALSFTPCAWVHPHHPLQPGPAARARRPTC